MTVGEFHCESSEIPNILIHWNFNIVDLDTMEKNDSSVLLESGCLEKESVRCEVSFPRENFCFLRLDSRRAKHSKGRQSKWGKWNFSQCTVVTFLSNLGQKVFIWVIVATISNASSNIMKNLSKL